MTTEIKRRDWENWFWTDWENEWKDGCNIYKLGEIALTKNKVWRVWRAEKRQWLEKKLMTKYVLVKYRLIWSDETDKKKEPKSVYVEIEEMREYQSRNALMNALRRKNK